MKTDTEYKIIESAWVDEFGEKHSSSYFIQKHKTFLGIKYWKSITHRVCYESGCYNEITYFKTIEDAKNFIRSILCPNRPYDKCIRKEVFKCNCNN